ncbi:MAG: hypothetical protein LIP23_03640, partial [Planctomycetes bacterium]|nr:hypothetical protein [Planctomycetota bacterium]
MIAQNHSRESGNFSLIGNGSVLIAAIFVASVFSVNVYAAEAAMPSLPALAASGLGRLPRPGEWLEFTICYPLDPLENSLSPEPQPPPPRQY